MDTVCNFMRNTTIVLSMFPVLSCPFLEVLAIKNDFKPQ